MNPLELFGNASEQIVEAIKRGIATQDKSHRQNPHHRIHTRKYADGRQKRGRAHFLSKCVGNNFVKPQPSEKARERKARRENEAIEVGQPES